MTLSGQTRLRILVCGALAAVHTQAYGAVWWYEQAERLQFVSATLLDGVPISEPVPTSSFVEARLPISLLPKVNPKVGSKQEKVPAAPVHTVATLVGGFPITKSSRYALVPTLWAGGLILPKSIAQTIGVKADLSHTIFGASFENVFILPKMILKTSLGGQYGQAKLTGAITGDEADDAFNSKLTAIYLSQGVQGQKIPLWANAMIVFRQGKSTFEIKKEKTEFVRTDTMADAPVPLALQVTLGFTLAKTFHLSLSEYIVPNRLIMPRVSLAYQMLLDKSERDSQVKKSADEPVRRIEKSTGSEQTKPKRRRRTKKSQSED